MNTSIDMAGTPAPNNDLYETAIELAYQTFEAPTDDHVATIYARLVFNARRGTGLAGALTLH